MSKRKDRNAAQQQMQQQAPQPSARKRHLIPRWRFMTWIFLLFNAAMLAWLIVGVAGANKQTDKQCTGPDNTRLCHDASNAGTAIGVTLLIVVWLIGFFVLGLIWIMSRPSRHCPQCGNGVKKGRTVCKRCGYSFVQQQPMQQWQPQPPQAH